MLVYLLFIIGFVLLIKGADLLVDGAASTAKKLKISNLVIGLTVVAFGTSMPEFVVNMFASFTGQTEIAIGNILGSNIFNILFILGISSLIVPLAIKRGTVWKEIPLSFLAALLVGIMANDAIFDKANYSGLTRIDGLVFIAFFIIFLYYTFGIAKVDNEKSGEGTVKEYGLLKSFRYIFLGLACLIIGGKWIVDGAVNIATMLGVSQSLIALTIISAGTSLPELATSAVAAYKKQFDISVGNIVGSNIFNIFWILGVSAVIRPLPFKESSNIDILMTLAASFLLFLAMFVGKKNVLERWQGALFILVYIAYVAFLIIQR